MLKRLCAVSLALSAAATCVMAESDLKRLLDNTPSRVACEVAPLGDQMRSFLVFHLAALNGDGGAIYRTLSPRTVQLLIAADGTIENERSPCISEFEFSQ